MSWLADEKDVSDEEKSDRFVIGNSSIPKMKKNRKRSSSSAGLVEDFCASFERKLKLVPSTLERLEVADKLIQDPSFMLTLMESLPELCVRKLAVTSSKWRALAYQTLRERKGNNAFSALWVDFHDEDSFGSEEGDFDFSLFYHRAYRGGPLSFVPLVKGSKRENENLLAKSRGKVNFILTYGSANMESNFMALDETTKAKGIGCTSLMVLSSSILATTPDCKQIVDAVSSITERKLVTCIMFPQSPHISFECFVVPSIVSEDSPACISNVTETPLGSAKKPKALILYQYLNLIDSEPGIVQVLQALKMTQESAGFPMVTGIYNFLDSHLPDQSNHGSCGPVACGLLICGDDLCNVSVISVNLTNIDALETIFQQIEMFYGTSTLTTKYSLMFYHNEVTNENSIGALSFWNFIKCFRTKLPDVNLHGVGSLSGAHAMFVNPDSNQSFNQLNIRMMELTGTEQSKTSSASLEVVLVLLAYQAE